MKLPSNDELAHLHSGLIALKQWRVHQSTHMLDSRGEQYMLQCAADCLKVIDQIECLDPRLDGREKK